MRTFSGPYFLVFGLKTEICKIILCIQAKYGKIRTRKARMFCKLSKITEILSSELFSCCLCIFFVSTGKTLPRTKALIFVIFCFRKRESQLNWLFIIKIFIYLLHSRIHLGVIGIVIRSFSVLYLYMYTLVSS